MSEDVSDISKRLAELEESEGKRRPSKAKLRRPSPAIAVAGILGISALGVAALLAFTSEAEQQMDTASPDEFQSEGEGFGSMAMTKQQELPAPAAAEPAEPSEADQTLLDALAALQDEVKSLKAQAPTSTDAASSEAIDALNAQIAALQERAAEAQKALEDELQSRDQELARLRSDLELAQLQAAAPQPYTEDISGGDPALADLERRRLAEEEARRARVTSPLIAFSNGAGGNADGTELEAARLSDNEAFVRDGASPAEVTRAEIIANPANTVTQGTMIQAVTETALDSSLPGGIRAIVAEDVHSYDGSRVLIPRGSRLIGRYRSDLEVAQKRILVAWDRIILPDNQTVEISAYGGDALGRSGTTGFVDTRFSERFLSATLISLIGAVPAAAAGVSENALTADTLSNVGDDLENATQGVIGEYLSISPTIHVDQGTLITVMVDRDLDIY